MYPTSTSSFKEAITSKSGKALSCCGCLTLIVVSLAILASIGASTSHPNNTSSANTPTTTIATPKATETLWTVTHTFSGNGAKKTEVFHVSPTWRIGWSCEPSSALNGSYNVQVSVRGADDSFLDPYTINTICSKTNTGDATIEHKGGDVYLDINSEGSWKVDISEIK